ncbi:MAG: Ig-like domain-containing protein [candidate division Zixibacteria bacterium]|nr:Ig-like domain-containing protein [candidate division Zixibacteria bacterium]
MKRLVTIDYPVIAALMLMAVMAMAGSALGQNNPPVLDFIPDTTIVEGGRLDLTVTASDPDGDSLTLTTSPLPDSASFEDYHNNSGILTFTPDFNQAGVYTVVFYASDGIDFDSQAVEITVTNVNQPPELDNIPSASVVEGDTLTILVVAHDPDGDLLALSLRQTVPALENADFTDNHDGTGTFQFRPDYTQGPTTYGVSFIATDGELADTVTVSIQVLDAGNRAPVLAPIGPKQVAEMAQLTFTVVATDPDNTIDFLYALDLPTNASFNDNGNNTGRFSFSPAAGQAGSYTVTFIVSDSSAAQPDFLTDTMEVAITVTANTGPPVLDLIGPKEVVEEQVLEFAVHAADPDGFSPILWYDSSALPKGTGEVIFVDSGNGTAVFSFQPKFWRQGEYSVEFFAGDGAYTVSEVVAITVIDAGNQRPVIDPIAPGSVNEGDTLTFTVLAHDPDDSTAAAMPVALDTVSLPAHATLAESTWVFIFSPDCRQGDTTGTAVYDFIFFVSDGQLADTEIVPITVIDTGNWLPTLIQGSDITTVTEGRRLAIQFTAADCEGAADDFWLAPSPDTGILPANVRFTVIGNESALFEFNPDYTQNGSYLFDVFASDGENTVSIQISITVTNVAKDADDPGEADTLSSPDLNWAGTDSILAIPFTIFNDSAVAGGITGFRWFDTNFVCDSIVLGPLLDNAWYKKTMIFPDSMFFEAEFVFYDSQYIQPPGGYYFTAYFTNHGPWGPGSVLDIDTVKIGNNGFFVFDKMLKGPPPKFVEGAEIRIADLLGSPTYPPLILLGEVRAPLAVDDNPPAVPDRVELEQNFPNPFNPETTIRFSLGRRGQVSIIVYNILGQRVATLTDQEYEAGEHQVIWDGRDGRGRQAASGIYLYQIKSEQLTKSRKMILLR